MSRRVWTSKFVSGEPDEIEAYTGKLFGSGTHWQCARAGATNSASFLTYGLDRTVIMEARLQNYAVSRQLEAVTQVVIPLVGGLQRQVDGVEAGYGASGATAAVTRVGQNANYRVKDGTGLIVTVPQSVLLERGSLLTGSSLLSHCLLYTSRCV